MSFCMSLQTTLSTFQSPEFSVTRQHEDFVWLHDTLTETTDYAGLIVSSFQKRNKLGFFFLTFLHKEAIYFAVVRIKYMCLCEGECGCPQVRSPGDGIHSDCSKHKGAMNGA